VQERSRGIQPSKRPITTVKKSAKVIDRREKAFKAFFEEYWHIERSILNRSNAVF